MRKSVSVVLSRASFSAHCASPRPPVSVLKKTPPEGCGVRVWFDAAPLMSRPRHDPSPWARSSAAQNALNVELWEGGYTGYLPPTEREGPNYPYIWSMGTLCDVIEQPTPFASGAEYDRDGCVFPSPNPNASFWWYRQTVARSTSTGVLSVRSLASLVLVGRDASRLRASATLPPTSPLPPMRCAPPALLGYKMV